MSFLLLGVDSLIAGIAICPIVERRWRVPLAALFGVADGVGFLIGAGLGWHISEAVSLDLQTAVFVVVGLNLLLIAAGTRRVAGGWPVWVLPWALTLDNLTYGLVGEPGALLRQTAEQVSSSALLALAGLLVAVVLPKLLPAIERRATAHRVAGSALLFAAAGLVVLG